MVINFEVLEDNKVVDTGTMELTETFLATFPSTEEAVNYALENEMYTIDDKAGTN